MSGGHLTGWRLNAGDELTVMDGSSARLVSVNCGGLTGRNVKEGEDCARLIAAAPELLEALEWALSEMTGRTRYDNDGQYENCIDKAEAAIARARGAAS